MYNNLLFEQTHYTQSYLMPVYYFHYYLVVFCCILPVHISEATQGRTEFPKK